MHKKICTCFTSAPCISAATRIGLDFFESSTESQIIVFDSIKVTFRFVYTTKPKISYTPRLRTSYVLFSLTVNFHVYSGESGV